MMTIELRAYTDPTSELAWGAEPRLRRLLWELGDQVAVRWVMTGFARKLEAPDHQRHLAAWLEVAADTGMPLDPRLWLENPISSSYPACQAVIAAREQGQDAAGRYLRRLREALFCERKRIDHADALVAEAGPAGINRERFEVDLRSHAITESFGADLDEVRAGDELIPTPSYAFIGADDQRHELRGPQTYDALLKAATAAGATSESNDPPETATLIKHFGRIATAEITAITGKPQPIVEAELWALAREWRVKPIPVLTGTLWEGSGTL
jgi:predicted DsbA family dithiol-disulfide isomerase